MKSYRLSAQSNCILTNPKPPVKKKIEKMAIWNIKEMVPVDFH